MSEVAEKLAKAKKLSSNKATTFVFKDEATQEMANTLVEVKDKLNSLQDAYERGLDVFNQSETNDLLEKSLDQAVELQRQADGKLDELVGTIIEQVAKIRPVVNLPEQKREIINKIIVSDWKKEYTFTDSDKTETTTYVGFVNPQGGWYIERVTKSKTSDKARFIFGKSDYVSNWGSRLQHNYKYLYEAING
jgi:hypothetical protein